MNISQPEEQTCPCCNERAVLLMDIDEQFPIQEHGHNVYYCLNCRHTFTSQDKKLSASESKSCE